MKLSLSFKPENIINKKISLLENLLRGFAPKEKLPLGEVSKLVQKNIIDGIELVLSIKTTNSDLELINKILKKNKIPILSVHQPILKIIKIDLDSIINLIKTTKKLSAQLVVVHLFALGNNIYDPSFISKLKSLENQYGIRIGLENSIKNLLTNFWGKSSWSEKYFAKTVRKAGFMITFDTAHMGYSNGNIINFYQDNRDRIVNIHLSDYRGGIFGMHRPLGEGSLPIKDFLELLRITQYRGIVTLEINSKWNDIQKSIDLIQVLRK